MLAESLELINKLKVTKRSRETRSRLSIGFELVALDVGDCRRLRNYREWARSAIVVSGSYLIKRWFVWFSLSKQRAQKQHFYCLRGVHTSRLPPDNMCKALANLSLSLTRFLMRVFFAKAQFFLLHLHLRLASFSQFFYIQCRRLSMTGKNFVSFAYSALAGFLKEERNCGSAAHSAKLPLHNDKYSVTVYYIEKSATSGAVSVGAQNRFFVFTGEEAVAGECATSAWWSFCPRRSRELHMRSTSRGINCNYHPRTWAALRNNLVAWVDFLSQNILTNLSGDSFTLGDKRNSVRFWEVRRMRQRDKSKRRGLQLESISEDEPPPSSSWRMWDVGTVPSKLGDALGILMRYAHHSIASLLCPM